MKTKRTNLVTRKIVAMPDVTWDNGWKHITEDHLSQWKKAFPKADVATELERMNQWLWANPARRKKNYPRFIISWLGRAQEVGLARPTRVEPAIHCSGNAKIPEPQKPEEIEAAVEANKASGKLDMIAQTLRELRRKQPEN